MPGVSLVTIPNVEIAEVGMEWPASTGPVTLTAEDLQSAIQAQDDPAMRSPVLKLGHVDPRFDGEPCFGVVRNMRLENNGQTLVGDLQGVPAWLADIMPYAYPSRSLEGAFQLSTATGNTHQFAITALALLGIQPPAIATLADIQAVFTGATYSQQVAASATIPSQEGRMPNTQRVNAAIQTTVEDVRRAYYDQLEASQMWWWIRSVELEPNALIVDDDEGGLYRVPFSVNADGVTFEDPQKVAIEYVPVAAAVAMSATHGRAVVHYATAQESRPQEGQQMDIRERLGLPADATDEEVSAKLDELLARPSAADPDEETETDETGDGEGGDDEPAALTIPENTVLVDASALAQLQRQATLGAQAFEAQRVAARDDYLNRAMAAGKFGPTSLKHFAAQYDRDEKGTRALIDSLASVIPTAGSHPGHPGYQVDASAEATYPTHWLTETERARAGYKKD